MLIEEINGSYLFAVADGLGGFEAGEIAAKIAVEEMRNQFLLDPGTFDLKKSIMTANSIIIDLQKKTSKNMRTTIAALHINGDTLHCAHVGDSRIYIFNNDSIIYQSIDHSVSQVAVQNGEINSDQIRKHSDRNKLTRALGNDEIVVVEVKSFDMQEVNAVIICSDGFWEYVYEKEMTDLLIGTKDTEQWLVEMRKLLQMRIPFKNDNNTAIAAIL